MQDGLVSVSTALCDAKMEAVEQRLERIERDGQETRAGVGKILRTLVEGNGQPSHAARIQSLEAVTETLGTCVEEIKTRNEKEVEREEQHTKDKRGTKLVLTIALVGWIVTIVLNLVKPLLEK